MRSLFFQSILFFIRDLNDSVSFKGMREIGVTCSGQRNADDSLSLAQAKFTIGDYMDINITPPNRVPQQRRRPY